MLKAWSKGDGLKTHLHSNLGTWGRKDPNSGTHSPTLGLVILPSASFQRAVVFTAANQGLKCVAPSSQPLCNCIFICAGFLPVRLKEVVLEEGVGMGLVVTQARGRMGLEQAICALSAWTKDCNMSVCLLNLTHSSSLPPNTLINQTATSQVEKSSLKRGGSKKRRRYDSDPPPTRAAICFKSALTEHNKDASIQCAAPQRERK